MIDIENQIFDRISKAVKKEYPTVNMLVIADQNAAVNAFPGLVHTARHTMEVGGAQSWS